MPSCSCCVYHTSHLDKQAVCRRGSNHPFTGASEHAPPLPAEVQAQRWAEDYDSYKVTFLSLTSAFFLVLLQRDAELVVGAGRQGEGRL